jgi:antitoxin MazE
METRVQKWGDSLAIQIPQSFADETQMDQDTLVDISLLDGKLIVAPIQKPKYRLEDLLAGITEDNLHQEVDFGDAVGNEIW